MTSPVSSRSSPFRESMNCTCTGESRSQKELLQLRSMGGDPPGGSSELALLLVLLLVQALLWFLIYTQASLLSYT